MTDFDAVECRLQVLVTSNSFASASDRCRSKLKSAFTRKAKISFTDSNSFHAFQYRHHATGALAHRIFDFRLLSVICFNAFMPSLYCSPLKRCGPRHARSPRSCISGTHGGSTSEIQAQVVRSDFQQSLCLSFISMTGKSYRRQDVFSIEHK